MAEYRILLWGEIPAQVKVKGDDGKRLSGTLPDRYQEEIDRVAMEEGLTGTDAYLDKWQWGPPQQHAGPAQEVLYAVLADLDRRFSAELFGDEKSQHRRMLRTRTYIR